MKFCSAVSQAETAPEVLRELVRGVEGELQSPPDLAVLFFTAPLTPRAAMLAEGLRAALNPGALLGVSCEGVIGGDLELERRPGASLLTGALPGVTVRPFHIAAVEWRSLLQDDERLQQRVGTGEEHQGQLILGDP